MADFWGILNKYLVECIHFFRQCRFDIYKIISDVKMVAMESQKALRHWPLWGKFAGVRWITPHKGSVTRKMFPFEDVIMIADIFKFIYYPGTHFTNNFSITSQIRWKIYSALIQLLVIISQQNLAHATTAQLSCHVPNFVAITLLVLGWEQNEISITFELWWKNC